MADKEIYSKFELGDMLVVFIKDNRILHDTQQ